MIRGRGGGGRWYLSNVKGERGVKAKWLTYLQQQQCQNYTLNVCLEIQDRRWGETAAVRCGVGGWGRGGGGGQRSSKGVKGAEILNEDM